MRKKIFDFGDREFTWGLVAGFVIGILSLVLWFVTIYMLNNIQDQKYPSNVVSTCCTAFAVEWLLPALPSYIKLKKSKREGFVAGQFVAFVISMIVIFFPYFGWI